MFLFTCVCQQEIVGQTIRLNERQLKRDREACVLGMSALGRWVYKCLLLPHFSLCISLWSWIPCLGLKFEEMELGLRLGEAPKPFPFMDTSTKMSKGFGFCLGLGVGSHAREGERGAEGERERQVAEGERREGRSSVDSPVQLDLLPLVPVPRYPPPHLMFSLPAENSNIPHFSPPFSPFLFGFLLFKRDFL